MTDAEDRLVRELERRADDVPVAAVPLAAMVREADVRRRRPVLAALAAAAVAAVAVGIAVVAPPTDRSSAPPAAPAPTRTAAVDPTTPLPPPGTRYAGHGRVAVAVPEDWGTNVLACAEPARDTVIEGNPVVDLCDRPRAEGVESVEVLVGRHRYDRFPTVDFAREELELDGGVEAFRSPVLCDGEPRVCAVSLEVPAEEVQLVIESSTGRREVEDLVAAVRVLPEPLTKRVGLRHVSIAVLRSAARCATAPSGTTLDTEELDRCLTARAEGARLTTIEVDPRTMSSVDWTFREVGAGDEVVLRSDTVCARQVCRAALWVPSERVGFLAGSATGAASVEALLDTVRVDPGMVAVPQPVHASNGAALPVRAYEEALADLGLEAEVEAALPDGDVRVRAVSPEPGTVVPVGSTVHVTPGWP